MNYIIENTVKSIKIGKVGNNDNLSLRIEVLVKFNEKIFDGT